MGNGIIVRTYFGWRHFGISRNVWRRNSPLGPRSRSLLFSPSLLQYFFSTLLLFHQLNCDDTIPLDHVSILLLHGNPGDVPVHTSANPCMSCANIVAALSFTSSSILPFSSTSLPPFFFSFTNLSCDITIPLDHVSFLLPHGNPGHVPVHTSAKPCMSDGNTVAALPFTSSSILPFSSVSFPPSLFSFTSLSCDNTIPLDHVSFLLPHGKPGHVPVHTSANPCMSGANIVAVLPFTSSLLRFSSISLPPFLFSFTNLSCDNRIPLDHVFFLLPPGNPCHVPVHTLAVCIVPFGGSYSEPKGS